MADAAPNEPRREHDDSQPHRDIARWTFAVAIFTALLVIVSAISDWFIYQQYRVANEAQIDTREQLRALVSFAGGQILTGKDAGAKATFYLFQATFRNFGATRTQEFRGWDSVHYFEGSVPYSQDFTKPWNQIDTSNAIVPPNSTINLTPISISNDEAVKAQNHQGQIIIWGRATWSDIYEPTKMHNVSFCQILQAVDITDPSSQYIIVGAPPADDASKIKFETLPFRPECNSSD